MSMLRKLGDFVDELSTSHYCGISNENICMTLSQAEIYSWDIIVLYDFVTSRMSFKKKAFYVKRAYCNILISVSTYLTALVWFAV